MDIILKDVKLTRNAYKDKGEIGIIGVTRKPKKNEKILICKNIEELFTNLYNAYAEELHDNEDFKKCIEPLFIDENDKLYWVVVFEGISFKD